MLPKALVLDLDGTLADTEPLHERAWDAVLKGVPRGELAAQRATWVGMSSAEIAGRLIRAFHLERSVEELVSEKKRHFREMVRKGISPFPGLSEELSRWSGVALAVATSGSRREALLVLETLGLSGRFEVVVTADDVPRAKPAPDCYVLAAELLGWPAGECVAVEDSAHGMQAALSAGMRVLAVSGSPPAALPAGVVKVFPSTVEALRWLRDGLS